MRTWRSSAALQLAAVASVAVLVGHWLAYLVAVPHAGLRDELLLTSGHGYWLLAVKGALVLGAAALAASGIDALRRRAVASEGPTWAFGPGLVALIVVQLCSFTLLEAGERLLAGEPWLQMLHHDVYAWGALAQLLIAPLGAGLLVLFARALRRISAFVHASQVPAPAVVAVRTPALPLLVRARDWRGAFATRGPPVAPRSV